MSAWIIVALGVGVFFGYLFFYFRYENRELVNELRKNLKKSHKELQQVRMDFEEHSEQNRILKDQLTELFKKNDDLVRVVSDLSRYYYHMKVGAQKVQDLSQYLELPDTEMERKVQQYIDTGLTSTSPTNTDALSGEKKFF